MCMQSLQLGSCDISPERNAYFLFSVVAFCMNATSIKCLVLYALYKCDVCLYIANCRLFSLLDF